jgi:hypothetical protein
VSPGILQKPGNVNFTGEVADFTEDGIIIIVRKDLFQPQVLWDLKKNISNFWMYNPTM